MLISRHSIRIRKRASVLACICDTGPLWRCERTKSDDASSDQAEISLGLEVFTGKFPLERRGVGQCKAVQDGGKCHDQVLRDGREGIGNADAGNADAGNVDAGGTAF